MRDREHERIVNLQHRVDEFLDTDHPAWPKPTPLPDGLPPVPGFDYDLLPGVMRRRVLDISERMQCPPEYPAIGVLVMLAGVVGRRITIRPKRLDDWTVVPNLWGMIVGRPAEMKTPALEEVLRPLRAVQARAMSDHRTAVEDFDSAELLREQRKQVSKQAIRAALKKGDRSGASDLAAEAARDDSDAPVCRRWLVNDSTIEKLGEILAENPDGVLLYRDELHGFFKTLERQGHEADRAFYLESWNGDGSYVYDRIGRGTLYIENVCLSLLGAIQPGPLSTLVRSMRGSGDDGLLQRFQLAVWPDKSGDWRNVDRKPDYEARDEIDALLERMASMPAQDEPWQFDDSAQAVFDAWRADLETRIRGDLPDVLQAHLSKYRSLVPSLALLCALASGSSGSLVLEDSVIRAIGWADFLEAHARRIYAPALSPDMDAAQALAAKIAVGDIAGRFSLKDVYRPGWSGLVTRDDAAAAVGVLVDFDWLREDREDTSGRTRTVYEVNPRLRVES
jgi:putative DNA primase/helicase